MSQYTKYSVKAMRAWSEGDYDTALMWLEQIPLSDISVKAALTVTQLKVDLIRLTRKWSDRECGNIPDGVSLDLTLIDSYLRRNQ